VKIIVDTCIWSFALRRAVKTENSSSDELKELIKEVRVQLIGSIRQEILSGIKIKQQFQSVKSHLLAFSDLILTEADYELAAEYFNLLRSKGIQGSNTDFLICAASTNHKMPIFTLDNDFELFKKHIPIQLYKSRKIIS
jgi:predicted nucleic acid-binding protein